MEISVVIPTLNRASKLERCLGALSRQSSDADFEIRGAEGGSTDGTLRLLEGSDLPNLSFLIERKRGAGAARNSAVRAARGSLVAFTDDDCVPGPDWLSGLRAALPEDQKCAGVGGMVSPMKDCVVSRFLDRSRAGRNIEWGGKAIHLPTTNSMYRRSALQDVGLFDERVLICEDIELSQRILRKGYWLKAFQGAAVRHDDPADIPTLYRKSYLHGSGVATVALMGGRAQERGLLRLLRDLAFPSDFIGRYNGDRPAPGDAIAFAILRRVQILGVHDGYRDHISRR